MSTPNPLAPQGSLLEKQGRGRSTFQIIGFIGALHVFVLCALLWIGCKQDKPTGGLGGPDTGLPGQDTSLPPVTDPPVAGHPEATNPVVAAPTNPPPAPPPGVGISGGGLQPLNPPVTANPPQPAVILPVPNVPGSGGAGTTEPAAASEHKVVAKDTGAVIARKYGVSLKALQAANPNVNWTRLKIGQVIAIPAPTAKPAEAKPEAGAGATPGGPTSSGGAGASEEASSYTVRPGDTGSKIAKKHGVSWRKIRDLNGLTSDSLRPGQKLNIPAKGAASAPVAPETTPEAAPAPVAPPAAPVVTPLPTTGGR